MHSKIIDKAFLEFQHFYDEMYGGFGGAPKFPTPYNIFFLLRYWKAKDNRGALKMVTRTLEAMYQGGLYDHVGFGFTRYSTDKKWLIPHFKKMLYDNALLAIAYIETYQGTERRLFKDIAEEIFTYVLRDMNSSEGGFYSAEDADSEGMEGKFYLWDVEEVHSILGDEDAGIYCKYYDIKKGGNFEGKSIPNLVQQNVSLMESNEPLKIKLSQLREKLFQHREKRLHPNKDDKILTSWNGLMIAALALGGKAFQDERYTTAAEKAYDFISRFLVNEEGGLLAGYKDGDAAYPAYLDDYAFLVWGLIELYEATFKNSYLQQAITLTEKMVNYFWDEDKGGFYIYAEDNERLIVRPKDIYDGAMPSGNSVAALNLLRLSKMTGNIKYEKYVATLFESFGGNVEENPNSSSYFMMALMFSAAGTREIILAGDKMQDETHEMIKEISKRFLPFTTVIFNNDELSTYSLIPFAKEHKPVDNMPTAYVCENYACNEPITSINQLIDKLDK